MLAFGSRAARDQVDAALAAEGRLSSLGRCFWVEDRFSGPFIADYLERL